MADVREELTVANASGWSRWLANHGAKSLGVWLVLAKKGVTQPTSLTYDQALEEAICNGWIDGHLAKGDDRTFRRKFTPRQPGSAWSKRNVALASGLIDAGRMKPAGLDAVQRAKADGSWDDAYDGQSSITVPPDLAAALIATPGAQEMFDRLDAANRYAVLYRVTTAKRVETRQRRLEQFVTMLARGETIHPQRQRRVPATKSETKAWRTLDESNDDALLSLFRAIATGNGAEVRRRLDAAPALASGAIRTGATREDPQTYFLAEIYHYVYAGDTALHVAAAAHRRDLTEFLVSRAADVRARNRRGAEPLHYAADGTLRGHGWDSTAQRGVIACLLEAGADPDTTDKSGVAPLHRAVRTRSSDAVAALIEHGANLTLMNGRGSTPLHLAVQNTGKSNSGSDVAKEEQRRIIAVLLEYGASPTDVDANGKTVAGAASSDWIRQLLKS